VGYEVEVTEDGQQALEAALRRRPQIILADLKMARKDGLTLLRETREAGIDVAVVMISGEGDIPDAVSAISWAPTNTFKSQSTRLISKRC